MKKIILIGGSPTTGKSTLANNLSKKLGLPWISTDQIRTIMKVGVKYENDPNLFLPKGCETAEKFLNHFSAKKIAEMEFEQGKSVWFGIKEFIEKETIHLQIDLLLNE